VISNTNSVRAEPIAKKLFGKMKSPASLSARAIGGYARGCLAGGVNLPISGPGWEAMKLWRNRNWGHPQLVKYLERFATEAQTIDGWPGLLIGDIGAKHGMSEETRHYVEAFWKLVDEILNAVLFLMIGFEVFAVALEIEFLISGFMAIGLALLARLVAVSVPVLLLKPFRSFSKGVIPIMTWGGLKGGISVALALALPDNEWKPLILTATYIVVIFSTIVQGLTVTRLAERVGRAPELPHD